jgi:hypothetical protein
VFQNIQLLQQRAADNMRYLKKISILRTLGHYRDPQFIKMARELNDRKHWQLQFQEDTIVFTEETIDTLLTILQNKRLHSEFTNEDFDIDGKLNRLS